MNASCHLNPNKGIRAGQPALSRGLYTNVTECGCFSVSADKLFKVPGMSVIVPSATLAPLLFPILCLLLINSPTNTKAKECKAFLRRSLCLISLCRTLCCMGRQVGDVIVRKTKQNCGNEQLLMETRYSSLLFTALLFWSSPLLLPSFLFPFVHCHFLLSQFSFSKLWCFQ